MNTENWLVALVVLAFKPLIPNSVLTTSNTEWLVNLMENGCQDEHDGYETTSGVSDHANPGSVAMKLTTVTMADAI